MPDIKDLLSRFQNLLLSGEGKKEIIKESVKKVLDIDLNTEDIEVKNNIVYLSIKPIYKNEVLLKKERILSLVGEALGDKTPEDIR